MDVLKIATKTLQLTIQTAVNGVKSVVDAIKPVVDATKTKVDTIDTRTTMINTNVDTLLNGRVVKTIQRGTLVIESAGPTAVSVPISAVVLSKSSLNFSQNISSSVIQAFARGKLSSATSLSFERVGTNGVTAIDWEVVEYY